MNLPSDEWSQHHLAARSYSLVTRRRSQDSAADNSENLGKIGLESRTRNDEAMRYYCLYLVDVCPRGGM
jgi:hypothetical protein